MMQDWLCLPWHNTLWQQIISSVKQDTLAHAYLLRGVPGVGKLQFARSLAAYLLCHSPVNDQPCGRCKECDLLVAGTHPDIAIVEPDEPGRPIKVDRIRRLNDFAHQTAQQGGRRVIIMNPAEAMNVNAANALLKCLEEPGEDTLFLLVSARAGDMLPTIRSRCQQLMFSCPDRQHGLSWLAPRLNGDHEAANTLLDLVADAPLEALRFSEQGTQEIRQKLATGVKALLKGELMPVELGKDWQGNDLPLVLAWLGNWLDDAVKLGMAGSDDCIRNRDLAKMLGYIAGKTRVRELLETRDWLMKQRQILLEGGNLNTQMLMEGVFSRYLELVL